MAILTSLNMAFLSISRQITLFQKTVTNVLRFCVNFWVIFEHFGKAIFFFLKDRLSSGKDEMLKILWIWKIEN